MFEEFDFALLDDPAFKEDSVREELVLPILNRLGYTASPPNQICRSTSLVHPYVYIGTKRQRITIIPDYVIKRNARPFFVLDAKAPNENITGGANVEQAYSYAIHKDVRTLLFALCNGRDFALYHVSHWPALLTFPLKDIESHWRALASHIGSDVVRRDATFCPDLGIGLLRVGLAMIKKTGEKVHQLFTSIPIHLAARLDEDNYSLQSYIEFDGTAFLGTFDFPKGLLDTFLNTVEPLDVRQAMADTLKVAPFIWRQSSDAPAFIGLSCEVADNVLSNDNEQYLPFRVDKFF